MSDTAVYLYGFARLQGVRGFTHAGLEEIGTAGPLEIEGLAAIVSPIPKGALESGLSREPPDPSWIVPRALHHERVVEAALAKVPVLPVRFGCVFSSHEALAEVVRQHRDPIETFLHDIVDLEEWSLKAYLDLGQAEQAVLDTHPEFSERYRSLPTSPGTRYFLEKRLRESAREQARRAGRKAAAKVQHAIEETGVKHQVLSTHGEDVGGRDLLLKLALLIPRGRIDEVFAIAEHASAGVGAVPLVLERSGPWTPYHFCPILGETTR
jgi:hypothetical protein